MNINPLNKKSYTSDLIHNSLIYSYGFNLSSYSARLKLDLLLKYVKNNNAVLDAGCANGLFSFPLASFCKEVHGIDINQHFLEIASEKAKEKNANNLHFVFGDVENIPFRDKSFDCVFSYSCLVLVEDIYKAMKECLRVVKKNGFIILDITGKHNLSQVFWKRDYQRKGHLNFNPLSYKELETFCSLNNIKIIETHALGFLDQWKYLPFVSRFASKLSFIDKFLHSESFDLDYVVSNLPFFKPFANRWYIVCQKI
jgi:ubiquinone/menaquinone biosynthesis C-methylase UbiE